MLFSSSFAAVNAEAVMLGFVLGYALLPPGAQRHVAPVLLAQSGNRQTNSVHKALEGVCATL